MYKKAFTISDSFNQYSLLVQTYLTLERCTGVKWYLNSSAMLIKFSFKNLCFLFIMENSIIYINIENSIVDFLV